MSQKNTVTLEQLMKKRFLYERTEVRLTGRYAKKTTRGKEFVLFEIRPADINAPGWKKWLRYDDLYEIHQPLDRKVEFSQDLIDAVRRVKEQQDQGS